MVREEIERLTAEQERLAEEIRALLLRRIPTTRKIS